jgi:hypothetical protein
MPIPRFSSLLQSVAAVVLIVACAAVVQTRRHTPTGSPPSASPPPAVFARLIRAGGTLYWTVNQGEEHSVYAMTPPGRPRLLYREHGDVAFGALASLPRLVVVVVVDELATGSARIQLLPLPPGGPARTLATSRRIGPGDLLTDSSRLLWADGRGLQAMPAAGGPVRTLAREDDVRDLAVAGGRLYYVSGRTVKSVAVIGGAPTTEVHGANNITALCVSDRIYWSELGVTVQSAGQTHWTGRDGHYTTDISCAGSRLVWSDCPASHTGCRVLVQHGGSAGGFAAGPEPRDLDDDGATTAYLNANGPNVRIVDPAWTYQPAPSAPSRPECLLRPCYRTQLPR